MSGMRTSGLYMTLGVHGTPVVVNAVCVFVWCMAIFLLKEAVVAVVAAVAVASLTTYSSFASTRFRLQTHASKTKENQIRSSVCLRACTCALSIPGDRTRN